MNNKVLSCIREELKAKVEMAWKKREGINILKVKKQSYHFITIRMAITKKIYIGEDMEKLEHLYTAGGF